MSKKRSGVSPGTAGVDPKMASSGSVAWARWAVDADQANEIDILQQNSDREQGSMDGEQQHVAAEAPAEAGEAATVTVPAETGPASEATPGQVKVEAGSKADSKAPLEKTEASEGLPPVEAAVKEEPRRFETAAAAEEPMPGPSPEAHCGAADTAVKGLTACSNAEPDRRLLLFTWFNTAGIVLQA